MVTEKAHIQKKKEHIHVKTERDRQIKRKSQTQRNRRIVKTYAMVQLSMSERKNNV